MARYIYEEYLVQKLSSMIDYCEKHPKVNGLTALFQMGDAIMDCPTADVAPKTEVAREIFAEIETIAKIYTFPVVKNGIVEIVKEPFWCIEPSDLTKLKKKYTEVEQ